MRPFVNANQVVPHLLTLTGFWLVATNSWYHTAFSLYIHHNDIFYHLQPFSHLFRPKSTSPISHGHGIYLLPLPRFTPSRVNLNAAQNQFPVRKITRPSRRRVLFSVPLPARTPIRAAFRYTRHRRFPGQRQQVYPMTVTDRADELSFQTQINNQPYDIPRQIKKKGAPSQTHRASLFFP